MPLVKSPATPYFFHVNVFITPKRRKMGVTMKTSAMPKRLLCIAVLLLAGTGVVDAQNIYKCTRNGEAMYTDHPCQGGKGQLLHQADDSEIIDQYLDLGQDDAARQYAGARHLDSLYKQRVDARRQRLQAAAQQQAEQAAANQQRAQADQQQALIDAAASRGRLQAENDALRQQNAQYQNQQAQPVYNDVGPYYNGGGYWGGGGYPGGHDHDHGPPPPPPPPVFHPCTPVAGGTVKC